VETCGFTGHHKLGFNVTRADIAAFTAAHELASVVAEKVHNPNLTGPARALSIAHITTSKPAWQMRPPEGDVVWVSPADILARRTVPVPPPVRESLSTASAATAAASSAAAAVATVAHTNCQNAALATRPTKPPTDPLRSNAATLARPRVSSAQPLAP
jgi:hypothetical protein